MRYIPINRLTPGMLLARPIMDEYNNFLLGTHSPLTLPQIQKLERRGFSGVYIEDDLSEDIFIEDTLPVELQRRSIEALQGGNPDVVLNVAKDIVNQLLSSKEICLDLRDLRSFDDYTYRHCVKVCTLSTVLGMRMRLKEDELVKLSAAALLHDMGKLMIDPKILNKPGKLTPEEYKNVKEHSRLSYELIKDRINISAATKVGVLFHHENEDGTGYPANLHGDKIHIFAKIIHVTDVYDALTSRRPYKDPIAISEAIEYLMGGCGTLFSQRVVEAFLKFVPVYPRGSIVRISDGREAIVVKNCTNPLRPVIRFMDGSTVDLSADSNSWNLTIVATPEM